MKTTSLSSIMKGEMTVPNRDLQTMTRNMRVDIIEMCYRLGENAGHLGGCMSLVELLAVLYEEYLHFDLNDLLSEERDRVIMSKGQGSIAMYAAMHEAGILRELTGVGSLVGEGNIYYKQSVRNPEHGLEFTSGSLGQGLGYAVGMALGLKIKGNQQSKIYVFLGDGECDEGSVWEAASLAGHMKLNNIVVVVDRNGLQIDGFTKELNSMDRLEERWAAFGFDVIHIDGHNIEAIRNAYGIKHLSKPCAIIADTVKGKGVSFAENEPEWHQNVLTKELYLQALDDVGGSRC